MGNGVTRRVRRVVTTEQLKELVEAGLVVRLPRVMSPAPHVMACFPEADAAYLEPSAQGSSVLRVDRVADAEVQCISVAHPRHLYITDNFVSTHNTSNIVFLKSTDDSMLDTLQKMSGTTHTAYIESKTVTQDKEKVFKVSSVEGKVSYTMATKEEPVIKYNDMAFITERNSIVFRAGDAPVWNRNETILPMSWQLFDNTITHAGHKYTLQTIPTLSSAVEFDVRKNQPNFTTMLKKRMSQAERAAKAKTIYQDAYGYTDFDIETLDPDVYSDEVMSLIGTISWEDLGINPDEAMEVLDPDQWDDAEGMFISDDMFQVAKEVVEEVAKTEAVEAERTKLRYAGETISRSMLVGKDGTPNYQLENQIIGAFQAARNKIQMDTANFTMVGVDLHGADGTAYITRNDVSETLREVNQAMEDPESRTFGEEEISVDEVSDLGTWTVHPAFFNFLASLPSWRDLASGEFDREMRRRMD